MADIVETGLHRTDILDQKLVFDLSMVAAPRSEEDVVRHKQLYEALPRELTNEEVNSLGLRISSLAEAILPSRDAISNGHRAEVRCLTWLGSASLLHGDVISFGAIRSHVKTLGIRGKLAALSLWYEQKFN